MKEPCLSCHYTGCGASIAFHYHFGDHFLSLAHFCVRVYFHVHVHDGASRCVFLYSCLRIQCGLAGTLSLSFSLLLFHLLFAHFYPAATAAGALR